MPEPKMSLLFKEPDTQYETRLHKTLCRTHGPFPRDATLLKTK